MRMKSSKFFKHPIISSLIVAVILSLIPTVIPKGWSVVFSGILHAAEWLWKLLISKVQIPVWIFLVSAFVIYSLRRMFLSLNQFDPNEGEMLKDHIGENGVKWRFALGSYGVNLYGPYCPKCDLKMIESSFVSSTRGRIHYYICDVCKKDIYEFKKGHLDKEKRIIERNLRNPNNKTSNTRLN